MKQATIAGILIQGIGGFIIGYNGGLWGIFGLLLYAIGQILFITYGNRGPRTDWADEDTFFTKGVGSIQAKMGNNYPPGFNEKDLD